MTTRKTAPELIGFLLGWDIRDVSDGRYQPTRYASPAVYVCGNDYFCCPSGSQKPPSRKIDHGMIDPDGFNWERFGEAYGRTVYRSKAG